MQKHCNSAEIDRFVVVFLKTKNKSLFSIQAKAIK